MSKRLLFFLTIKVLFFCHADAMISRLAPKLPIAKQDLSFNDFVPILRNLGLAIIPPVVASTTATLCDAAVDFLNVKINENGIRVMMENGEKIKLIDTQSTKYRLLKSATLSSLCYFFKQSHLIPGIFVDGLKIFRDIEEVEDIRYSDLLGRSFVSVAGFGISTSLVVNLIPTFAFFSQALIGYPAAKFGLTKNKQFSKEPWSLWLYGITLWCSDHMLEPFGYSFYLQGQKDETAIKRFIKFFVLFTAVSCIKYFFIYPDHFTRMKRLFCVSDNRPMVTYENMSLPDWFCAELISKFAIMQFISRAVATDEVYYSIPNIAYFFAPDDWKIVLPLLVHLASFASLKALGFSFASFDQKVNNVMPIHTQSHREISKRFFENFKKFGLV